MQYCLHEASAENHLFSDWADPAQFETTKLKLLENDGRHFHQMVALDKKGIALPDEIGIDADADCLHV
jgi:hypothetical protein